MIFTLFIAPLLKLISSFVSIVLAAAIKQTKESKRYEHTLKHIEEELHKKPSKAAQLYGDNPKGWMELNQKKTVVFKDEIIMYAHRPLLVLFLITLWTQLTYPIGFMVCFLALTFYFVEEHIEKLKEKNWYKTLLVCSWVISWIVLVCSEFIVNKTDIFSLLFNDLK